MAIQTEVLEAGKIIVKVVTIGAYLYNSAAVGIMSMHIWQINKDIAKGWC